MIRVTRTVRNALRVLALAPVVACSEKTPLPALIPECDSGSLCGSTGGQGSGAGSGTGGGGDSGGSCGQITFPSQLCNTCVRATCCDVNAKCTASPDCTELFRCVNACAAIDMTCKTACRNRLQNAVAAYDNFIGCKDLACGTECAGTDAGAACGVIMFQNTACNSCMEASCCTEKATCSNNADCFALAQCASACPATDQACLMDCRSQHPNGATDYTSLSQCGLTNCNTQCQ